jgi:hypothetical protein
MLRPVVIAPTRSPVARGRSAPAPDGGRALGALRTPAVLATGAAVAAFVLYAATASHGAAWDDGGELGAGVAKLGIVHADGYPAYVLGGWVFAHLEPFGSLATRASLWSALAGAAAVGAMAYLVAWRARSLLGGALAALLLAGGGLFWSHATEPSVYPLLVLSLVLLLIAAYRWEEQPTPRQLAWLAAAAGLVSVSHRSGFMFLAAAAVLVVARGGQRRLLRPANLAALTAVLAPWLTALYIPLRAHAHVFPNALISGHTNWWGLITAPGPSYDQPFRVAGGAIVTNAWNLALLVVDQLSVAAIVLVPLGIARLRCDRVFLLCGLAPALIASALAATTTGSYAFWHLPLLTVLAFAAGAAVPTLSRAVDSRGGPAAAPRRRGLTAAATAATALAALTGAGLGIVYTAAHHDDASGWAGRVLGALPPHATITAPWSAYAGLIATQELEHRRPEVRVVLARHWPTSRSDLATASGYLVAMDVGPTPPAPAGVALTKLGTTADVERKGLTGLRFAGRLLGDVQYRAQAYEARPSARVRKFGK